MKHIKQGSLLVQQKSSKLSVALESLQIQQLPPPLKWCSNIYPCFLSGSVQFLVFTLLLFVSLLISSFWHGQWWGIFFVSVVVCSPPLFTVWVWTYLTRYEKAPVQWRGTAHYTLYEGGGCQQRMDECYWHFSDTPLGSDWLYLAGSGWFLQIKLQPLGGATDSDLYPILLADHNYNLSNHKKKYRPQL